MLALKKAVSDVKNRIPSNILNIAFMTKVNLVPGKVDTLDSVITSVIGRNIMLLDLNIVKGASLSIPLDRCSQYVINYNGTMNHMIIEIPYNLTDNKEILSVLGLNYAPASNSMLNNNQLIANAEMGMNSIDSHGVGGVSTTNVELIGPNTIMVHENLAGGIHGHIRVNIENDSNFRNINNRMANVFSKLFLLATKGYIYNELVLEIDKGLIYGGHDLSKFADIVDKYEDAWEEYDELLHTKWAKVSFINDSEANSRYIKNMISPIL